MGAQHWSDIYEAWSRNVFGVSIPVIVQRVKTSSHYPSDSVWFKKCFAALMAIELEYVDTLLMDIMNRGVAGALVEFGVFEGNGINRLWDAAERIGLDREIWGFDSFKGLSKPAPNFDSEFWQEGMYSCSRSDVERNVRAAERPRIKFVEGFYRESLAGSQAASLSAVAFARIDCDLYEPAADCLRFMSSRLSDGAVLVFDDWTHHIETGEARAFAEWVPTVPEFSFEYLFCGPWDHFYIRVWHRPREVFRSNREPRAVALTAPSALASLVGGTVGEGEETHNMIINQETLNLANVAPSEVHLSLFNDIKNQRKIIEEDYCFFSLFKNKETLFFDIGANIGAASMAALHLCGSVDVLAFEPNVSLRWYLNEVRTLFAQHGRWYAFHFVGLGDEERSLELYIPKIDNWHVVGEASMDLSVFDREVSKRRLQGYSPGKPVTLDKAVVPVTTFDKFGLDGFDLTLYDALLVKIDVENYEPHVLAGMTQFIHERKPILFVENSLMKTQELLKAWGYNMFDYNPLSNKITPTHTPTRMNVIYLPGDQLDLNGYQEMIER